MSHNHVASGRVIAVLLADGWHRIVRGSFHVGTLSFEAEAGPGTPGFRFEEADAGSPYQPTVLAGPLDGIIAVRQVTPAMRSIGEQRNGQRDSQVTLPRSPAGWAAASRAGGAAP